jgi:hypothetical protein
MTLLFKLVSEKEKEKEINNQLFIIICEMYLSFG